MESPRPLLLSKPTVLAGLTVALGLVLGTILLSATSTHSIVEAHDRSAHAQTSLLAIHQLLSTVTEAETSQRGYLLTHDDNYLAPYRASLARYPAELAALHRQLAGHDQVHDTLLELEALLDEKFGEIAQTITLRQNHGIGAALNIVESERGTRAMAAIRERLSTLETNEFRELNAQSAAGVERSRRFQQLTIALVVVTIALATAAGWWLVRRVRELEKLVTVCAWTHRVKWQGRWMTFEEYLDRRFNLHFTHGMSDEAAENMQQQIRLLPPIEDETPAPKTFR